MAHPTQEEKKEYIEKAKARIRILINSPKPSEAEAEFFQILDTLYHEGIGIGARSIK